jgi:hypothetical protein
MSLAFVITAYKQPTQFRRLIDALWHPDDYFVVHIDANTPEAVRRQFIDAAQGRRNIEFIPSIPVFWSGFSLCQAEWNAIEALVRRGGDWTHLMNITGQDFPLKTRDQMLADLARHPHANHMQILELSALRPHFRRRFHWVCLELAGKLRRLPIPYPRPRGFRNDWFGEGWHILSREFCEWAVEAPVADACLRYFRYVKHPHESWMQAIMMASPFADTVMPDNRRMIQWVRNSGNPKILTLEDLPALAASTDFFARKFDEAVDSNVLDALARRLEAYVPA